jgi:glyoxylase-like metal-dependent hydrolase (beta-lactamase superfamily II)
VIRPRQVALGVELFPARTPTLPPATHTNSYALGGSDVLLVEPATPYDDERAEWLAWARGLVSQGRHLIALVATHHHPDHVGGAAFLSRELGVPLWAHERTVARLMEPSAPAGAAGAKIERTLADGDAIDLAGPTPQRWRVLHTPGHAPGHVCLHEERAGVAVVGDMVASEGTILIEPRDGDMAEYLAQLDRLAGLGAAVALPAHGQPIDEPAKLFRHYVAHRLARESKVLAALAASPGASEISALVPVVYADTPPFLWPIAAMSLEAHLLKLEREGRAARRGAAWAAQDAP